MIEYDVRLRIIWNCLVHEYSLWQDHFHARVVQESLSSLDC